MAKPINMPKLSDEMTEGRIAEWLKAQGDEVRAGDVVAQVETEKATLDVEAFDAGVLLAILAEKGATVPVGKPIAWIGQRGEEIPGAAPAGAPDAAAEASAGGEVSQPSTQPLGAAQQGAEAGRGGGVSSAGAGPAAPPAPREERPAGPPAPPPRPAPAAAAPSGRNGRVVASPAARKQARERGVDLGALAGSGPGGRIVLADLDRAPPRAAAAGPAPQRRRRELPPRRTLREETVPLSSMRRVIARNLGTVKPGAPHFYLEVSADMRRAVALREQLDELGEGDVSLNDLVIKAAAEALLRHPEINASWSGEAIVHHAGVHVGMAVAVEDGLVTPVLRDADRRSVFELAREAKDLARRARGRKLGPDEYRGGTFTVSNLGMFGIDAFYAILNPPEAAILSVGAVQKVPWIDAASGAVTAIERCRFGLSGDHRVVDGATGARFLQTFKAIVESPLRLVVAAAP